MFPDRKYQGDPASTGEELLMNVNEVEEKGMVIEKAVREGYFTLPEALVAYRLSEIEYVAYLLLKNKGKFEATDKEHQVVGAVLYLVETFQAPSESFAPAGKHIMQELKSIVGSSPLTDDEVARLSNAI